VSGILRIGRIHTAVVFRVRDFAGRLPRAVGALALPEQALDGRPGVESAAGFEPDEPAKFDETSL